MKKIALITTFIAIIFTYLACSKSDPAPPPADPCVGVTVTVTGTVVNTSNGLSNGSITASATGTGLTYSINGGAFQSSGTFTGLAAGTHSITAKTGSGCTGSAQFIVLNPCTGVNITVTGTVTNATALNNDGSITVSATGGTGFTFSRNGGAFQASNVFAGLAAGAHIIVAKNSDGCTGTATFTVTNPCTGVTVGVTAAIVNADQGQSNGSITATATGGTGFTFSLNSGAFQPTGVFPGLSAGNYTITAKNSNGCTGSAQFTVGTTNPCSSVNIVVTTTVTAASPCVAPNGGIAVSASGGSSPYMYNLNGGAFQTSNIFNGLAANPYTIVTRDLNGCLQSTNVTVTTAAPGPLFNAVKQVLATNCALSGCHIGPTPQNGLDWTDNCTITLNHDRIKARAVDGDPSFMPPAPNPQLSAADKQKIVNWVNAGGQVNN